MKVMFTMKEKIWSFVFCFGIFFPLVCQAIATPKPNTLVFKSSSILNSLPSKDVQSVYQDRDGYIWISTRNGLFQYDGYSLTTYKSNLFRTDLLTNNWYLQWSECFGQENGCDTENRSSGDEW